MIERMGRKLVPGDVLEMPNMKDYWPLDDAVPASLKKFYVVSEVTRAAEGYSPTWWPHLYRVKVTPMVDGQEFKDILDQAAVDDGSSDATLRDIMSPYLKNLAITDALVEQAKVEVPKSGYNVDKLFVLPIDANGHSLQNVITADNLIYTTDQNGNVTVNANVATPTQGTLTYLNGDSTAPNGLTVTSLTYFPDSPALGQYILRTDYLPNTLYRWDGKRWQIVHDVLRTQFSGNDSKTQLGTFVNNTATTKLSSGQTVAQRQALSKIFLPKSDF
jgi:hypothetical protein